jgi:hypothetical protein
MKSISQLLHGPVSRLVFELGLSLILGAIGLTLAFALMLHCNTAPATAFAYLLFFTTLRSIATLFLTRERAIQFFVASVLCMAASFWALRSTWPLTWDRHDASAYSVAWRSAVILLCVLAVPRCASYIASRSLECFRPSSIRPASDIAID